jgi:anti-sigma regulatory factor (Ser/Thr protein kinase)
MRFGVGLPADVVVGLPDPRPDAPVLGIQRLTTDGDAEEVAQQAIEVLHRQTGAIAGWGDALHMGISELCDNALHHGGNTLGAYIAADLVVEPRCEFRMVVADLGIGIPEHIRARHPEWQNDAGAIAQVLRRGVTGTDDPQRGNGFSETIDYALEQQLVQASSAVELDIRAASGRVGVHLVAGPRRSRTDWQPVHEEVRGSRIPWSRHDRPAPSDVPATVRCEDATSEGAPIALRYILKDFGTSFATRARGRELREDVVANVSVGTVLLDFADVTNLSYSFADEFVGKLSAEGFELEYINMVGPVERSIQRAVARRTGAPVGC